MTEISFDFCVYFMVKYLGSFSLFVLYILCVSIKPASVSTTSRCQTLSIPSEAWRWEQIVLQLLAHCRLTRDLSQQNACVMPLLFPLFTVTLPVFWVHLVTCRCPHDPTSLSSMTRNVSSEMFPVVYQRYIWSTWNKIVLLQNLNFEYVCFES